MFRLFKSDFFNFEALRLLSFTPHEGGEIAEFFEALGKIRDTDTESWYTAWMEAASKVEVLAVEAEQAGNRITARRAYFRASNYLRAAQFMLDGFPGTDPRILTASETAISYFWRAATLLDASIRRVEIPYDQNLALPGYLCLPEASKRLPGPLPLLIQTVGGDATQEEIFYIFPMAALELGYAVLTFEGPGQGIVLRRHGVPFRPDWEAVVGKVLDFAHTYAQKHRELELDVERRVALVGSSMGGYLALRGAADPRLHACIAVDPVYSMFDLMRSRMPAIMLNTFVAGGIVPDGGWDYVFGVLGRLNAMTGWEFNFGQWIFGVSGAADLLRAMQRYTLSASDGSRYLHKVRCPVMVTGARGSLYSPPEISTCRIYKELVNVQEDRKMMWVAEDVAEGALQSKVGAFNLLTTKAFAWLDRMFEIDRKIAL
ncbi:hypothetical protein CFD26_101742 [Aspergillus turcosus]|uniref:AB hydrolase-1 domain-containing protein n=1 Tax=Aspergillus turcosus TaxID=1245748 RepID=A0A3R7LUA6_9EURO|nr:hypothetical protein CFD26_101742 [Aspergillus turcosus]